VVKGFVLFAMFVYIVFAFVIVKQTKIMTQTLEIGFENGIKIIAWMHFLFAIGLLFLSFVIL